MTKMYTDFIQNFLTDSSNVWSVVGASDTVAGSMIS